MNRHAASLACLVLGTLFATNALATCNPPSKPGMLICYPSPNAAIAQSEAVEGAATGDDSPIRQMVLYVDNKAIQTIDNKDTFTYDYFPASNNLTNGWHHMVLSAWDGDGHIYKASTYFYLDGNTNPPQCSKPSASGFTLCAPVKGDYYPESTVPVVATGSSNITGWSFSSYTHGDTTSGSGYTGNIFRVDTIGQPGYPTSVTVNATDSTGKKYTQSVSGVLTYYDGNCLRLCDPGVTIKSPQYFHDQPTKFTVDASVSQPQAAIDSMKVYLDGKVVATSTGPTIYATITATSGSHVLTVQAWDAKHALYRTQQTVNVD